MHLYAHCICLESILTAIAIAMDDSVTVSMGDEISGVFRVIFLVSAEVRSFEKKIEPKLNLITVFETAMQ